MLFRRFQLIHGFFIIRYVQQLTFSQLSLVFDLRWWVQDFGLLYKLSYYTVTKTWAQWPRFCMCHDAFTQFICELSQDFLIEREMCLHDSINHRKIVDKGDKDLISVCSRDKRERNT